LRAKLIEIFEVRGGYEFWVDPGLTERLHRRARQYVGYPKLVTAALARQLTGQGILSLNLSH
jgi:hypothetical protein